MRRLTIAAGAALALGCLTSCSSDETPSSSSPSTPEPAATAQTSESPGRESPASPETSEPSRSASVSAGRFCDEVEADSIGRALDITGVSLVRELEPGQEYAEIPGGPKVPSTGWSCEYRAPTSRAPVSVGLLITGSTMADEGVEDLASAATTTALLGTGGQCDESDAGSSWSGGGLVVSCSRPQVSKPSSYQSGYTQVAYVTVVDGRGLRCSVVGDDRLTLKRATAAADAVCPEFLELVTS